MNQLRQGFARFSSSIEQKSQTSHLKPIYQKEAQSIALIFCIAELIYLSYFLYYLFVLKHIPMSIMEISMASASLLSVVYFKQTHNYENSLIIFVGIVYFSNVFSCYYTGGLYSPNMYWNMAMLTGGELLGTKKVSRANHILFILSTLAYVYVYFADIQLPQSLFSGHLLETMTLINFILISFFSTLICRLYRNLLSNNLKETVKKNEQIHRFVGILCHDIANPLAVIHARSQVGMKRGYKEEKHKEIYETIHNSSTSIDEILGHVRNLEHLDKGKSEIVLTKINIKKVLDSIVDIFKDRFIDKDIKFSIDFHDENLIEAVANEAIMKNHVIYNLVSNSIKFCEIGGKINIKTSEVDSKLLICIEDDGVGIDEELVKDLFNKDIKTSQIGTKGERGTGFGLPLVYSYMKEFGGEIIIDSIQMDAHTKKSGTKVTLSLNI